VDAAQFIADLRRYLERQPCAILLAGSDISVAAVSRARDQLHKLAHLGLPPPEVVERSFNREVLARAAASAGLTPAPAVRCHDDDEAAAAARELGFPVLLKSISTVRERGHAVMAGPDTRRIESEGELRSAVGLYGEAFLVQRLETGRTCSFGGVIADGRLLGSAVSVYQRTWPPSAGNVSFSVTIEPPRGLEQSVTALLQDVGWQGMFEIELIHTLAGKFVPIDFNPRPYGSMALAVVAGANLPGVWCDWVLGRSGEPLRAHAGRRYRWEDADLRHLLWQLRRGNYGAAARTLRPWPGVAHPHFRRSDPLPLLARALSLADGKFQAWRSSRSSVQRGRKDGVGSGC
jgi:predicted ATP-grasp superfamily ATP-dependent carboligase